MPPALLLGKTMADVNFRSDATFLKRLKLYDKNLGLSWGWNKPLWVDNRWVVYQTIKKHKYVGEYKGVHYHHLVDKDVPIMIVRNEDESYRPLDNRVFKQLDQMSLVKRCRREMAMDMIAEEDAKKKREENDFTDYVGEVAKDIRPLASRLR